MPDLRDGPPLHLAERWDSVIDPTGWLHSEKLDGVRAYWDVNRFHAPAWFTAGLPKVPLDGELTRWLPRRATGRRVVL